VEPGQWVAAGERGLRDLYVALTRATQRVVLLHEQPLPTMLATRLAELQQQAGVASSAAGSTAAGASRALPPTGTG
jgi:ATP-dependent exoDNAse (exonuclease V) beta subunit